MTSGFGPTVWRLTAYHCGQTTAIWAAVASGPRCRAAIDHSESPCCTTYSRGAVVGAVVATGWTGGVVVGLVLA